MYADFMRYWGYKDPKEIGGLPWDTRAFLWEAYIAAIGR